MAKKTSGSLSEFFFNHRIIFLLVAILSLIIGSPFLNQVFRYGVIPDILLTIIFILGIHAISRTKKAVYIALFCLIARNRPLVPLKDPRLGEALNYEVH